MKYIFISLILFIAAFVQAQNIDMDRMDRDIEVAENILMTLMEQGVEKQRFMLGHDDIEGSYKDNYGVVFTVPAQRFKFDFVAPAIKLKDKDDMVIEVPEAETGKRMNDEDGTEKLKETFITFLADYGHLISQLAPSERILVKTEQFGGHGRRAVVLSGKRHGGGQETYLSAEIKKSDLTAYEKGSLSKDNLVKAIVVSESIVDLSQEPQIEVFAAMLDRLYDTDLSATYYMSKQPSYERMKDFGLTYYIKVYSSYVEGDTYYLPTVGRRDVSREERKEIVQEMYPKFVEGIKENMLEYGHILKNLGANEILVLDIKLTQCEGCTMPKQIKISSKKSIIDEYRQGKLNKDKAMASMTVKDVK
ncbi:MAG: hypothetical protein OEQ53_07300 [Saprospiraceae bacterium]|nr:hypothetical protein [Saprospiraceae bacterium]